MLLAAVGSVRIGKNCDLELENAALGLRPRAAFSRPRSQFSLYGPPSRPITYIYVTEVLFYKITEILHALSLVHKCVLMKVCKHGCDVLDWSDFEKRQF